MAKKDNTNVTDVSQGIDLDNSPVKQPKGTRRFTLNAVEQTSDGRRYSISNEKSIKACSTFPNGFYPIGNRYIEDNTIFVILVNPKTGRQDIGLITKDDVYTSLINTAVLDMDISNQCDIIYRLRRGNERVFYWVNGANQARTVNIDRLHNFYNETYQQYLRQGLPPQNFLGEKWDGSSFDLIKSYTKIPTFNQVTITETGSIFPGSYNFAIQLVDEDLNPTEWITTSNTVNIFNDTTSTSYGRIRGSRNINNDAQSFPRASKSIKLSLGNLDTSFPYYRVAIIRAAGNNGEPEKVLASDLYSTSNSIFLYTGNDANLKEVAIEDILIEKEVIFAPRHIEQQENTLILAHGRGKSINWCEFQKFASKIKTNLATKQVLLNNIASDGNVKNPNSTFTTSGYMPGEAYSLGIAYVFDDGYVSPAFHIPGKNSTDTASLMKYHEIDNQYLDVHNCSTDNYWGVDASGQTLLGKKIRHHRFPFRKDVNKPLVSTSTNVTNVLRYRLTINISLNPAYTPSPNTYPAGTDGTPLVINYVFNYKVGGSANTTSFSGQITNQSIGTGTFTILYDDLNALVATGGKYAALDATSQLATYQTGTNNRFIITETYTQNTLDSSINTDKSELFGLDFSNIEKPHPNVIGFYIVRNERNDDDKLIIDNAIFGTMTEFQQYKSFGLIMPKQYYTANNCGTVGVPTKQLSYFQNGIWFFNPEFQYFQKKLEFDEIVVEGVYSELSVNMPTISNVDGSACNGGKTKGVYIQDVQAGTSFNPEVNKSKNKDDDGFDLIIGYRNTNLSYLINTTISFPSKTRVLYLNAASYESIDDSTYYNVSVDNKIGMYLTTDDIDTNIFYNTSTKTNNLVYGALVKNNPSVYSNFISRPYFKEHNNPVLFNGLNVVNGFQVFNGDAKISSMNFVSSVFYDMVVADRPKKSKLWQIVVGAVLVVAAVVVTIATAGAATPLAVAVGASALSALAISYGVSLAMSGIKFEQFKSMIDTDYSKGLKDTVVDGGVFECIREGIETEDDTIRWFADRVSNIYMESSVPFGLRSGLTSGITDFVNSPTQYDEAGFRSYLTEKLTAVDRNQGSGRVYKGYATAEIYDMNKDYMRFNKQKEFIHLAIEYDCCSDNKETHPNRWWWSQQSFQEEKIDNFRSFLPNNYRDLEGIHGEITDLYRLGNNLFIHTKEALWQVPQNNQERVTGEITSFIGTGSLFSINPRQVLDDDLGSGGTQHKWGTIKTDNGVISINELQHRIQLHSDRLSTISDKGLANWMKENLRDNVSSQLYALGKIVYTNSNNPANPDGIGYISTYDKKLERVIITKRDYAVHPGYISALTIVTTIPEADSDFTYCLQDGRFYIGNTYVPFTNTDYFVNKSWTLSYSFNTKRWVSWHSYIPYYYMHSQDNVYSFKGDNNLYKHNIEGSYTNYYGVKFPFIVEAVITSDPIADKIFDDLTFQTEARRFDTLTNEYNQERYITFNKGSIYNGHQHSGDFLLKAKDASVSPKTWYKNQTVNTNGVVLAERRERDWNINKLRDYVIDYSKPMFTSNWDDIKSNYYIDKVTNTQVISFTKSWTDLQSFRDKFIIIRLKFDSFDDVNLVLNYIINEAEPI